MSSVKLVGTVKALWRYPVKSLQGESIDNSRVLRSGIPGDRAWAFKDLNSGEITGGKKLPQLMTMAATYSDPPILGKSARCIISLPDNTKTSTDDPLIDAIISTQVRRPLRLFPLLPRSYSKHYRWNSPMSEAEIRHLFGIEPDGELPDLSHYPDTVIKEVIEHVTPRGAYFDSYPLHLLTTASLQYVKERAPNADIRAERFRPNLLIDTGKADSLLENNWIGGELYIGSSVIYCDTRTVRCSMPGQAQPNFAQDSSVVYAVANFAERHLGVTCTIIKEGEIKVGDEVRFGYPKTQIAMPDIKSFSYPVSRENTVKFARSASVMKGAWLDLVVTDKVSESENVVSICLKDKEGSLLPAYLPGQFISVALPKRAGYLNEIRNYSLSGSPDEEITSYRITVKHEYDKNRGEEGVVSSYIHKKLKIGDILRVRSPSGTFAFNPHNLKPVVLISMGVGVTPMMSICSIAIKSHPDRKVWFFHGVRNGSYHIFKEEQEKLAKQYPELKRFISYSAPQDKEKLHVDYHKLGRLSFSDIKQANPPHEAIFFLCGKQAFINDMRTGLKQWGVEEDNILSEHFTSPRQMSPLTSTKTGSQTYQVRFRRSKVQAIWTPTKGSLLEFAESMGLTPDSGCRFGSCQACIAPLLGGEVKYQDNSIASGLDNKILLCCSYPASDLEIDM